MAAVWLLVPEVAVIVTAEVPAGVVLLEEPHPVRAAAANAAPTSANINLGAIANFLRPPTIKMPARGRKARAAYELPERPKVAG